MNREPKNGVALITGASSGIGATYADRLRPAHAKGARLTGTFTPSVHAQRLTRAPHVLRKSTPVTARFSNSTGLPLLRDNDANADPRGLAIRFDNCGV